jgi:hypothetical protein
VPSSPRVLRVTLALQGGYYVLTGTVPFASRRAFESVTGPKADWWLVQTVSVLVDAVGAGLLLGVARRRASPELLTIAAGSAIGLGVLDTVHVLRGRIARTYLLDAALQAAFAAGIAAGVAQRGPQRDAVQRAGVTGPPTGSR